MPRLHTNEAYVEEVTRETRLALDEPMAVFAYVFGSLPERVKVYPTENYYYFTFIHAGRRYAGNIRLDASNRDDGKVIFAYFDEVSEWKLNNRSRHIILDAAHGVKVEKVEPLVYRVNYGDKSVVFALNDLSDVKPPSNVLAAHEKFVGPIFDESAIRFFLVYNTRLKVFHYLLDETVKVADHFTAAKRTDRILIGDRTGFAFYQDRHHGRKILIGVYAGNQRVNNYFDGPFDQLPDNFLEGDSLRRMILEIEPGLKGRIDRFGGSPDGSVRYVIAPYLTYDTEDDLYVVHRCATGHKRGADAYYRCFVVDDARPRAGRRAGRTKPAERRSPRAYP